MGEAGCEVVLRAVLAALLGIAILLLLVAIIFVLMMLGSGAENGQQIGTLTSAAEEFYLQLTSIAATKVAP